MKRSTVIIIIILTLSIIGGGLLGFYLYLNSKKVSVDIFGREIATSDNFGSPSINTSVIIPGNSSSTNPNPRPILTDNKPATSTPLIPILRKIYSQPVAGFGLFEKELYATSSAITETVVFANGTTTSSTTRTIIPAQNRFLGKSEFIYFLDRANGHIYETSSSTLDITKTSNTTFTKTQEASLLGKESIIVRSIIDGTDIISTKFGQQRLTTSTSTDKSFIFQNLQQNITELAVSPTKNRIFAIQKDGQTGIIMNSDGKSVVNIFNSPFKEWLVSWPSEKTLTITTKPSYFSEGFMYKIDVTTKRIQKVLGDLKGMTTLMSPDEKKVLVSATANSSPNLFSFDMKTKEFTNLYLRTFTDKCTWSKKEASVVYCAAPTELAIGNYPDIWYRGQVLFNDAIWKVNTETAETSLFAKLNDLAGESIDVVGIQLSKNEDYLLFNNKADLSLWGLRLLVPKQSPATGTSTTATSTIKTN